MSEAEAPEEKPNGIVKNVIEAVTGSSHEDRQKKYQQKLDRVLDHIEENNKAKEEIIGLEDDNKKEGLLESRINNRNLEIKADFDTQNAGTGLQIASICEAGDFI